MTFKEFLVENENMKDAQKTLSKLPKSYQALIKNYKFEFQPNMTLNGDKRHIGIIDEKNKKITLAAPNFFGRDFVLCHELAHCIWKTLLPEMKEKWHKIAKPYLKELKDTSEEIFCHSFANYWCHNPLVKYDIPVLKNFIKNLPK